MEQMTLTLDPPKPLSYLDLFHGLTTWTLTSVEVPPFIGWWRTRSLAGDDNGDRRWWDGDRWSVSVNASCDDRACEEAKLIHMPSRFVGQVVWCGLARPHLAAYEIPLVRSDRLVRLQALQGKE